MKVPWGWLAPYAVTVLVGSGWASDDRTSGQRQDATSLPSSTPSAEVCASKTINYITHTLPQQCLRTPRDLPSASNITEVVVAPTDVGAAEQSNGTSSEEKEAAEKKIQGVTSEEEDAEELAANSFMSFEEWKEMMLRKSAQESGARKGGRDQKDDTSGDPDGLGDYGEIAMELDALTDKLSELSSPDASGGETAPVQTGGGGKDAAGEESVIYDDGRTQYYRSKDAGTTSKERFSYASFDAGATVKKTSPGAKNAKALLAENKDTYMLLECATQNKFVIVELSDDILVDTVALANFEFFSSMIRRFRVSVADRYPVKADKWVELGTFEARNSRDVQPFLIEHPQIYTKYIRIEFLSHFGNEYYCPVSLLRVHGTRMLDSWKETEDESDTLDELEYDGAREQLGSEVEVPPETSASSSTTVRIEHVAIPTEVEFSRWPALFFEPWSETCPATSSPSPTHPAGSENLSEGTLMSPSPAPPKPPQQGQSPTARGGKPVSQLPDLTSVCTPTSTAVNASASPHSSTPSANQAASNSAAIPPSSSRGLTTADSPPPSHPPAPATAKNTTATTPSSGSAGGSGGTGPPPPPPTPTVQDSFFKAVNKRLTHLESNTTLSLQYVESQSRFLQDTLARMERRQIARVDGFLTQLNDTALAELRSLRTQYDQVWQGTVLALEAQREQAQREVVALSARLGVLADEVVFQKRMAILQSVLLLACMALVIFSRGLAGSGYGDTWLLPPQLQQQQHGGGAYNNMSPSRASAGGYSASSSPIARRGGNDSGGGGVGRMPWNHIGTGSPQASPSRGGSYNNEKTLPLTPTSDENGTAREGTPVIQIDGTEFYDDASATLSPGSPSGPSISTDSLGRSSRAETLAEFSGSRGDGEPPLEELEGSESSSLSYDRSSLSQIGSARKPLPALPEDPS